MRAILLSMLFYLAGIAAVLHMRPALMFHPDGRWKEFGIRDPKATVFPFWGFCLVWALFSFGLTRLLFSDEGADEVLSAPSLAAAVANSAAVAAAPSSSLTARVTGNLADDLENVSVEPLSVPAASKKSRKSKSRAAAPAASLVAPQPGYYKLDERATDRNGAPRYIYVGPELPAAEPVSDSDTDATEA
jgi:hypothetical protein